MPSTTDYLDYVYSIIPLDMKITWKKMMGEFLLYYNDVLFGGIYDNLFLIKMTPSLKSFNLPIELPYSNAKPMYLVNTEDLEEVRSLIEICVKDLK